jgi:pimeloyl-ACP methyl ester carboxylesterase
VITYDRRGFGHSSQPSVGYEYDTFAADLDKLLTALDLVDVDLAGHSMGGGAIARYLGAYGSGRIRKAVVISGVPPREYVRIEGGAGHGLCWTHADQVNENLLRFLA